MATREKPLIVKMPFMIDGRDRSDRLTYWARELVIAGWTGRDTAAVEHHIEELAAIGVPRPSRVPLFYRAALNQLLHEPMMEVVGPDTSGEVEFVLLSQDGELLVGCGSDHTDRKAEAQSVALSKQLCAKMIASRLWRFADVAGHWDRLMLRSYIVENGKRVLYQEGPVTAMRAPQELISLYGDGAKTLTDGAVMFCGTLAAIGGIRPADRFEFELEDPVLGRRISHAYAVRALPIVS